MPESRRPTTREIAGACGCSQSTVSNALRNDPRIPDETRARIQHVAREMGWKANPMASAFMAHLRSTKAPRYQANLAFGISNPHSPQIEDLPKNQQANFHGARERAEQLGYILEPVWLQEPGLTADGLARMLRHRGIPGLIIPGMVAPTPLLSAFAWNAFSTVALGHVLNDAPLHRVAFNYSHSIPVALRRLFELGYRRIAVVVSTAYDKKVNHGWLYPLYYEQKQAWGRQWIKSCVFSGDNDADDRKKIRAWLERERPDVVLGEYLAWHVMHEMGWQIPDDVAFATFDCSPDHAEVGGIDQRHHIVGAMAADILTSQLIQNESGVSPIPKKLLIEGLWRDAPSVPAKADADAALQDSRAS